MSLHVGFLLCGQLVAVEDVKWADVLMVPCLVVFTGVVGTVENIFSPKIYKLPLSVEKSQPISSLHVDTSRCNHPVPCI